MSLKIIAGKFRGRNLETLPGFQTRPLLSRTKKSLFDILTPKIVNSIFLDLFAGFGSVGIEALSRGAKKVTFVESDGNCIKVIEDNLVKLGILEDAEIVQRDASQPDLLEGKFDIIFIGPPYQMKMLAVIIGKSENLLSKNGIIIGQHHKKEILPEKTGGLSLYRQEKYGDMRLSFYKTL
ncbi:MAG TPA: 16S rRNA (guanine(966)-N(2))-methyltransferase RsmD [Elusimicrobia bacterium]|nr:16S rRNA (guanine(966)-N(2))-methyltransferase RsmD [Elusimicrobiota bacterium]